MVKGQQRDEDRHCKADAWRKARRSLAPAFAFPNVFPMSMPPSVNEKRAQPVCSVPQALRSSGESQDATVLGITAAFPAGGASTGAC